VRLPVFALALGAFAIGTTEFVTMGLLPEMAGTFGVSIPAAGGLVTAYALGVVLGAPVLTAAAHRFSRRRRTRRVWLRFEGAPEGVHVIDAVSPGLDVAIHA